MSEYKYQIVFLGSTNVGKTELFNRMIGQTRSDAQTTIQGEASIIHYSYNGIDVPIQLWDTAGQERYRSLTSLYTKRANGIFLVFDLSDLNSSEDELAYIDQQIENSPNDVSILIIGNKIDQFPDNKPPFIPDLEKIKNKIDHFDYIETSAINGLHVSDALDLMIQNLESQNSDKIACGPEPHEPQVNNSGCC